ncbi:Uma2 family endonuclease [Anabaena minutissima FACHB-250]|nr:Uma2 family endonuclease [Anabaena minutissima FACHB-250]
MLNYNPLHCLPSAEDLPDSDDEPVDNQLQHLIPGLLEAILAWIWSSRMDWFFGVDMGIYYDPEQPPIFPDGFLSLGVERVFDENLRLSYVLWEEKVMPMMTLEVVSHRRRGEYTYKKKLYSEMEVLYYVVYNPQRRKKPPLEVYKLINNEYVLQPGNTVWLAEIGLAIGYEQGTYQGITRDWLYWYDAQGVRYLSPEERAIASEQRANTAEQRAQRLAAELRRLGIDPDNLS